FVSFTRPAPQLDRSSTGAVVGLDMGIASTATTSDGQFLRLPELLTKGESQCKRRVQRKLARQTKGSNRRKRTKLAIAKLAAKETDRRKDWMREDDYRARAQLRHHCHRRSESQEHDPFG
ncbi:MAG: transposase, partial [Ferrimicrobium sp.]